jgi:phage recombination protein Bet
VLPNHRQNPLLLAKTASLVEDQRRPMKNELIPQQKQSALAVMASRFSVEPAKLLETLKATLMPKATNEELLSFVVTANQYGLNPFTREIYAFPARNGGIQPVVSVDGWIKMMNSHPQFNGIQFTTEDKDGKPFSVTATIHHKDRSHPVEVTEYFSECYRATEPWKVNPRRMLRHKALIQCARVAFGFSGIVDEEEAVPPQVQVNVTPSRPIFRSKLEPKVELQPHEFLPENNPVPTATVNTTESIQPEVSNG